MGSEQGVRDRPALTADPDLDAEVAAGRKRYTISVVVGLAVVLVPYLWVLWDDWTGKVSPTRLLGPSNFYELQARGMAAGHLYVPNGSLGIEGFLHGGHTYTYFGIFPSLIRLPVMAVFPGLDGSLTAPSILTAWFVTCFFCVLLLWRVRILARGAAVMGWTEAASCGALMAAIGGGSVLMYLASSPWVYDEDFAWSAALAVGSLFALLGVMERPSRWRIVALGVLISCSALTRLTTGYACIIGGLFVVVWLAVGRGGPEKRRWTLWVLLAVAVPLGLAGLVNWLKFGSPLAAFPLSDQVWSHISPHRQHYLAVNKGKIFNTRFLPSTLYAYLRPTGIRFSGLFPFITLPDAPARAVGNVYLDQTYATGSVTATMPLLFLLSLWGLITAFRPKAVGQIRLTRVLLIAAAMGTAGILMTGYIANRYLADILPFLVLAGMVGFVDIWRRAGGPKRNVRIGLFAVVAVLTAFCVVANVGAAINVDGDGPWTTTQATNFLHAQLSHSITSVPSTVVHGSSLPVWAPTGEIFDLNNCSDLYLSNGIDYSYAAGQLIQREVWIPIEQQAGTTHTIKVSITGPLSGFTRPVPILTFGRSTVVVEPGPLHSSVVLRLENGGPAPAWPLASSPAVELGPDNSLLLTVMTDPHMHSLRIAQAARTGLLASNAGELLLGHYLAGSGPAQVTRSAAGSPVRVMNVPRPAPSTAVCRRLQ